jgi:hypothetical protein
MDDNPYAPPAASVSDVGRQRFVLPLPVSLLAGAVAWLVFLQVVKLANIAIWNPLASSLGADSISLQISITALPVFAACGGVIGALSRNRWWVHWLAFAAGIVICIGVRSSSHAYGLDLAIGILRRAAFLTAIGTSGIVAGLMSHYLKRK